MLSRMFSFSGPQLGNPSRDADQDFALVERALEAAGHDVDIYTAIVFTASVVDLEVDGSSHPVLPVDELADFVRDIEPDPDLTTADRESLVSLFSKTGTLETAVKTSTRRPVKVKKRAAGCPATNGRFAGTIRPWPCFPRKSGAAGSGTPT